jgi:hypothetical protein
MSMALPAPGAGSATDGGSELPELREEAGEQATSEHASAARAYAAHAARNGKGSRGLPPTVIHPRTGSRFILFFSWNPARDDRRSGNRVFPGNTAHATTAAPLFSVSEKS